MRIGHITILVKDINDALAFYIEKLGFVKREDTMVWFNSIRWATVSPKDQPDIELTFVLADTEEKEMAIGKQAGDHIFMTLQTDDLNRDYTELKNKGVNFVTYPEEREWGTDAIFEDLYGNLFDLVERPKQQATEKL